MLLSRAAAMASSRPRWPKNLLLLCCAILLAASSVPQHARASGGEGQLQVVPAQEAELADAEGVGYALTRDEMAGGGEGGGEEGGLTGTLPDGTPLSEQQLLHWALEHSNKDELRKKAEAIRGGGGDGADEDRAAAMREKIKDMQYLIERRKEIREVLDNLAKMPTEADIIKSYVEVIVDGAANATSKEYALNSLRDLVEPVDNANDFHTLGGLLPTVDLLRHESPKVRAAALGVLAQCASNNHKFSQILQEHVPTALDQILTLLVGDGDDDVQARAVSAAGSISRTSLEWRQKLYDAKGIQALRQVLAWGRTPRLQRRAMELLTDLATLDGVDHPDMREPELMCAIVVQVGSEDLDTMEKALRAVSVFAAPGSGNVQRLHKCQVGVQMGAVQHRLAVEGAEAEADHLEYIKGVMQVMIDVAARLLSEESEALGGTPAKDEL